MLLCYCANVHPGETLEDVLAAVRRAGEVKRRAALEDPGLRLGLGLWLSRRALDELLVRGESSLSDALSAEGLCVFTMNGFPYGNFHAEVVKRAVYHPDWSTEARRRYTRELAGVLARLMPQDTAEGTISTLPLGHLEEAAPELEQESAASLSRLALELAELRETSGRRVRVCLEPEPGCLLESTGDAIRFFTEHLWETAERAGAAAEVRDHLGLCFDACHQAVGFEDAAASLAALDRAGVTIGKVQLSCGLVGPKGAVLRFAEPRFLHQVRVLGEGGAILRADDLPLAGDLPADRPWRVHFHAPIHRELVGAVTTTRPFLEETLDYFGRRGAPLPHLEVETYTWSVLPEGERPQGEEGLAGGIADELRWAAAHIG